MNPIWTNIFQNGLKPPTSDYLLYIRDELLPSYIVEILISHEIRMPIIINQDSMECHKGFWTLLIWEAPTIGHGHVLAGFWRMSCPGMVKKTSLLGLKMKTSSPTVFSWCLRRICSKPWLYSLTFLEFPCLNSVVFRHRYCAHEAAASIFGKMTPTLRQSVALWYAKMDAHRLWLKFGVQTSKIWAKNLCHDDLCANGAPPAPEGATCCHHHPILQCLCGGRGGKARSFITTCEIGFATGHLLARGFRLG